MDIESIREYCLSLPLATEDMPFGEDCLVIRLCGKIFACIGLTRPDYFVLKCDPDYAIDLQDRYPEITPAWHWNKKHWIQLQLRGSLQDSIITSLIHHSYAQVAAKLGKKVKEAHPEILLVENRMN